MVTLGPHEPHEPHGEYDAPGAHQAPGPGASRARLTIRLVEELLALDCVRDPTQRYEFTLTVSEYLRRTIALPGRGARSDTAALARSALRDDHGLEAVLYAVALYNGDDIATEIRHRLAAGQPAPAGPPPPPVPGVQAAPAAHSAPARTRLDAVFSEAAVTAARALLAPLTGPAARDLRDRLAHELSLDLPTGLTAAKLFDHLLEANAQPDGLPPAVVLTECAAARPDARPREQQELETWGQEWAAQAGLTGALYERRQQIRSTPGPSPDIPRCVVVMADPADDGSPDIYVRHWINPTAGYWRTMAGDTERATMDTLADAVDRAIRRGERLWLDAADDQGPVFVEFVLPFALLNHDVARLELDAHGPDPLPIGPRYFVHLRSLERMRAADPRVLRAWRERWDTLRASGIVQPHHWSSADLAQLPHWRGALMNNKHLTAVTLNGPAVAGRALEPLRAAIAEGIGLALWDRRDVFHPQVRELLSMIVGFPPDRIPATVHTLRARAEEDVDGPRMVGRHLAFFWDDPYRLIDREEVSA
ncbi:effector-associated domain 2-containing protein [Streptomyces sp. YIM 98790]|uniref:VMAP-C domain-containing protein n=1 Tax=Streptomyces sp. YIM 98790 TaxID=2689077 RepID=UPI001408DFC0|nr:hypothetical protein [Streptomyces sp. YIM 98790]